MLFTEFLETWSVDGVSIEESIYALIDPIVRSYPSEGAAILIDAIPTYYGKRQKEYLESLLANLQVLIRDQAKARLSGSSQKSVAQQQEDKVVTANSFKSNIPEAYRGFCNSYEEYSQWNRAQVKEMNRLNAEQEKQRRTAKKSGWRNGF